MIPFRILIYIFSKCLSVNSRIADFFGKTSKRSESVHLQRIDSEGVYASAVHDDTWTQDYIK